MNYPNKVSNKKKNQKNIFALHSFTIKNKIPPFPSVKKDTIGCRNRLAKITIKVNKMMNGAIKSLCSTARSRWLKKEV